MSVNDLRLMLAIKMLLMSGKNVVFVGAPGVGKTRFARVIAKSLGNGFEPVIIVGRDGLSFDDLVARYHVVGGNVKIVLGPFTRAVIVSWLGISSGFGVQHILFDEINRCNVDVVLGEIFTALDIEHRLSIPVVRGHTAKRVEELIQSPDNLAEELSIDKSIVDDTAVNGFKAVVNKARSRGLDGIPMPYKLRMLATMNIYDRAQLYRLGYALQRRFAFIYIQPLFEPYKPVLNLGGLGSEVESAKSSSVYDMLMNIDSIVYVQGFRELFANILIGSLHDEDTPTIIRLVDLDELRKYSGSIEGLKRYIASLLSEVHTKMIKDYGYVSVVDMVSYIYSNARSLGLELGASLLVDIAKIFVMLSISSLYTSPPITVIPPEVLCDIIISSLVLPQLSAVVPRLRAEALLLEQSRRPSLFTELLEKLSDALGKNSLTAKMVEGLSYELPMLKT